MQLKALLHKGSAALAALLITACATGQGLTAPRADADFPDIGYATWTDEEPPYRIYPGDELEVTVPSAPELNKTLIVQPDGRISLPLIRAVMVADRTPQEVEASLGALYADQLVRPEVYVGVKTATPLKVFVGGEVDKPGVYDMPGDINALQAVVMAGGFKTSAKRDRVVIIRRGTNSAPMMRTANLGKGINHPAATDLVPLRRFDIIYVPRTGISEAGVFMGQLRDLLPGSIGFSYALNGQTAITTF